MSNKLQYLLLLIFEFGFMEGRDFFFISFLFSFVVSDISLNSAVFENSCKGGHIVPEYLLLIKDCGLCYSLSIFPFCLILFSRPRIDMPLIVLFFFLTREKEERIIMNQKKKKRCLPTMPIYTCRIASIFMGKRFNTKKARKRGPIYTEARRVPNV